MTRPHDPADWLHESEREAEARGDRSLVPVDPLGFPTAPAFARALRAQLERERDRLAALAADAVLGAAGTVPAPSERVAEPRRTRFRERLRERALARQHGIDVDDAPEPVAAPVAGTLADVVGTAAGAGFAPLTDLAVAAGAGREVWDAPCEQWLPLPAGLPRGRHVALRVAGESMCPLLHPGDLVLVRLGGEPRRGQVVVARRPDHGYVVKSVGAVGSASVELLSLNPAFAPLSVPRSPRHLIGTVVHRWRAGS